jgi:hypothetical protein
VLRAELQRRLLARGDPIDFTEYTRRTAAAGAFDPADGESLAGRLKRAHPM